MVLDQNKGKKMSEVLNMSLIDLYTAVLDSAMYKVDEDGQVLTGIGKNMSVAEINGRKVVLPKDQLLRNPSEENVFFHPLSEQMTRGESEVFRFLRRTAILKLSTAISTIGFGILKLQEHPELQRKMKSEQQDFIKGILDTDKDSALTWCKMNLHPIQVNPVRTDTWPVDIFIKRNGQFDGKNFRRVAIVSFPAFEKVMGGEKFVKGSGAEEKVLFRPKDYLMFQQVTKAIFPGCESPGLVDYNVGYDGTLAPYFIAFFKSYRLIAKRLNYILDLFKDMFIAASVEDVESARIDLTWMEIFDTDEGMDHLSKLARRVPALQGNIGSVDGREDKIEPPKVRDPEPAPVRRTETRREEPVTETVKPTVEPVVKEVVESSKMTDEHRRLQEEALLKRQQFLEEERLAAERAEERRNRDRLRREEEDRFTREELDRRDRERESRARDYTRDRRDDRDYDDRDSRDRREPASSPTGKASFSDLISRNRALANTRSAEEEEEYNRGRGRGRRDYRDDRYYDDRRDRRDYRDRDDYYDRRSYRGSRRDDRDYDDRRSYRGYRR